MDITPQINAEGYVSGVTMHYKTDNEFVIGDEMIRPMIFCAYALAQKNINLLDPIFNHSEKFLLSVTESGETKFADVKISQQVSYQGYEQLGDDWIKAKEKTPHIYELTFSVEKA